jgi:hypothetical protein
MLIIDAHSRGIASLDIDVGTGTCVTGSSDWGIRKHELGEWGLDIGQGKGEADEGEGGTASSEYPTIRRRQSGRSLAVGGTARNNVGSITGAVRQLDISPRQVQHPHGFEFRAGQGCCIATRSRYFPSQPFTPAHRHGAAQPMGFVNAPGSGTSTPGASHACFNCEKKGHTDLVRSLWLGDDVVFSGSYDSKLKVRPLTVLRDDCANLFVCIGLGSTYRAVDQGSTGSAYREDL